MKEQQLWFDKLAKDREDSAKTLEKPSMRGIKNSVVEKYSDQAHFIYELLQNANDAKATKSLFQLTTNGLYFRHNGKILFSVSNPETEDQDKENNTLGHINSITAIANSNKTESSIGKFGVGFKAVFQYTETPHIYDPNFQFRIDRFIIPVKLNSDLKDRQKDETVFFFPFNKTQMSAEKAYSDILEKLKKLVFPTLFLSNLQEVKWNADSETGEYAKKSSKQKQADDIIYEKVELYQQIGLHQIKEKLYLFSRTTEESHSYSIGFFLDEKNKLTPKQFSAFCFFPTKETTNLNFILHAPFLLTDSRESIKRFEKHNAEMSKLLSQLAADSMLILRKLKLINDYIIKIIPYKKPDNTDLFVSFYETIKEKFKTEKLLPAKNEYVERANAYWAEDNPVLNLFSDEQLAIIINEENAKWVFRSFVRNQTRKEEELRDYIENCTNNWYEMSDLLKSIDADFIENQSDEWLHKLYEYLSKNNSYWSEIKTKPIFLNQERKAVPAFEQKGKEFHEILFLPSKNLNKTGKTINSELLKNEKTKEFIENFGLKQPSLKDEIYNHILPLYDTNEGIDTRPHFEIFFKYWKEEGRPEDFINLIKDKSFILYKTNDNKTRFRGEARDLYYPTSDLEKYFKTKPDTRFVDLEDYHSFIRESKNQQELKDFLLKLGVRESPRVIEQETKDWHNNEIIQEYQLNLGISIHNRRYNFTTRILNSDLDGLTEILSNIDSEKSLLLWGYITKYSAYYNAVFEYAVSTYETRKKEFPSYIIKKLKTTSWLKSTSGKFVSPNEITINELAEGYDRNQELERLLDFKSIVVLTEAERIASKFESEADADLAKTLLEEYKAKRNSPNPSRNINDDIDSSEDELPKKSKIERTIKNLDDLQNEFKPKQKNNLNKNQETETKREIVFDEDVEFAKGIEDLKNKLEIKKSRVDLAENIINSREYSFDWFKSYLKLLTTYSEKQDNLKQKSISFQDIKPYKADNKYFLLCGANGYISHEIENSDDFKVSLIFGNGKRENIIVEGVSKKGQDLLIYCREPLSNNTLLRLPNIFKVEINFTPVIDLLDRLYKVFTNDNYIDKWDDIHKTIPSLDFIYGPPGTGKTTTLCNRIIDILSKNPDAKFLVLTPTNKAADVVCKKLRDIYTDIYAVRLSHPTDPDLEEFDIYRDTLNLNDIQSINVVTSTIHRLPYFDIIDYGLLFQYEWDYVIFDESSMTGLHYMTFAIMAMFKSNSKTNFIVAGDPKQIPPVIEIDDKELENFDFQDENIYKMMNLISFNPKEQKIREIDRIQNLDKQYRSIPKIGQLFSELSYSNQLKHDRTANGKEVKILPEKFKNLISSNVTFIDIPLSQDSSIYRVNKLYYSSYHTYCAILVSEIIKYFDTTNTGKQWTIGLIAPYKAQAMLMNKLITSYDISENIKVISDTVHGFQGDECDIVFFVCNPNNYSFTGHKKSLLSKEYIYNVAISRAKDYLIILHPHSINNPYIKKIRSSYLSNFGDVNILNANEIEKILFGVQNFIENNCYMSGHDNINVFGYSEMKYFIKASDTAIDIQIKNIENLS